MAHYVRYIGQSGTEIRKVNGAEVKMFVEGGKTELLADYGEKKMKLFKLLLLGSLIFVFIGCADIHKVNPITMKVTHITDDGGWGCKYKTYFRSNDGRVDYWCGRWGDAGDEISGYWHTDHIDGMLNGFRRFK